MFGALLEQLQELLSADNLTFIHVLDSGVARAGIPAHFEPRHNATGATGRQEVEEIILVKLHEVGTHGIAKTPGIQALQFFEHRLDGSGSDAAVLALLATVHCVGLAGARLPVGQDCHVETVDRRLHEVLHLSEDLFLFPLLALQTMTDVCQRDTSVVRRSRREVAQSSMSS
eukprot:CAMPEP_0180421528 /NCGR_PEP_ID=MMETSP1036_2-20121128/3199_2 /TAXON_ID=632150 /ORGANISM="Azadinium spinosum, Strain 3D9" /LENGTH=171 /DNA_ID=CAMNT_0022426799 /DNA_START=461 /DNA_END=977 /DNA_ORIENTATION=-